jgi:spermidine synthase
MSAGSENRLRLAIFVAAFSGFVALSYEIVWYRVLFIMTRGIAATFGLLLGAYLFGLAIGAKASGAFCRGKAGDPRALRVLALFVAVANVVAALVGPTFAWSAKFTDFRLGLVVVAVGAAFLGAVLPLVAHFGIEPDDRAGERVSYVYLANIVGSATGSLVTGFVLMDRLSLVSIARVLVVAGFALAALLAWRGSRDRAAFAAPGALALCALVAVLVTPRLYDRLYERLVFKHEFDGTQRFAQVVENKSGVVTVAQDGTVYGSGIYDGVVNTALEENDKNWIMRAYVVGAIHPAPREVLMIGLSSGSWAQVIAHLPGVEHLTAVEINPGYLDVIAAHPEVASVLRNPKVSIEIDDGRRWLQRHDKRFDVIVMNTTLHWRAHATNLLSKEFLEIARRHLLPGGVLYFNTTDSYDVQLTAARAFPHLWRITNHVAVSDSPFHFDREQWHKLLQTMRIDGKPILDLERDKALYEECAGFIQIEPRASMYERVKVATVVTDDNMVIEWEEPLRYPDMKPK